MVEPSAWGCSVITSRLMAFQVCASAALHHLSGRLKSSRLRQVPSDNARELQLGLIMLYCILWMWEMLPTHFNPENGVSMYLRNDDSVIHIHKVQGTKSGINAYIII
jgi:hypothetical protein